MSLVGTKVISRASTEEKIRTLAKTKPEMAKFLNEKFQSNVEFNEKKSNVTAQTGTLDRYTRNAFVTLFSAELRSESISESLLTPISEGISGVGSEVVHQTQGVKETLNELLKPVSSVTGATLGNLTNVLKDPLGSPTVIGGSLMALVDKVNPDFANALDATFKKYKADELTNLPGQALGSIRNLASLADSVLSVPFGLAEDLYTGLMGVMQEIGDLADSLISSILSLFFGPQGVLDSIIPISMLQGVLDAVGEISSIAGSASQMFGRFSAISNISSQITSYTSQASNMLSNPAELALQYAPPQIQQGVSQVQQGISMLRNPQSLIEGMVPQSVLGQMQQLQNIPGLGFVGNLGYGLRGTLETLSDGVLTKITDKFSDQLSILSPGLNMSNPNLPAHDTQSAHVPEIRPASTNPNIATVQGVPVQTTPRSPIFENINVAATTQQQQPAPTNTINLGAK